MDVEPRWLKWQLGIGEPGPLVPTAIAVGALFVAGLWYFARRDAAAIDAR